MRLPRYQPNQVQVNNLPNVRVSTSVPNAYGEAIGQGLQSLSYDIAQVAQDDMRKADNTKVEEAITSITAFDSNSLHGEKGLARMNGKAAMDRTQPLEQERSKHLAAVRKSLNPRQQIEFDYRMRSQNAAFQRTLSTKFAQASDDYADDTHKNNGLAFIESVGASAPSEVTIAEDKDGNVILNTRGIDEQIARRNRDIDAYYDANGNRFGDPEGSRKAEKADEASKAHGKVMDALTAEGRDADASAYFKAKKGEMQVKVRDEYQALVTRVDQDATIKSGVDKAWEQYVPSDAFEPPRPGIERPTFAEMQAKGHEYIDDTITDQDAQRNLAKEAKDQYDAQLSAQYTLAENNRRGWAAELDAEIADGASWKAITSDSRYARLSTDQQQNRATAWNAHLNGADAVTPPETYATISEKMTGNQDAFLEYDFREMAARQEISHADKIAWEGAQADIIRGRRGSETGGGGYAGTITPDAQINRRALELIGDGDDKDSKRLRGEFEAKVSGVLRAQFPGKGEKPSYEDVQKALDDMTTEVVYSYKRGGGMSKAYAWIGNLFADDETSLKDIPEREALAAASAMRSQGLPVTPSNIVRFMAREKVLAGDAPMPTGVAAK